MILDTCALLWLSSGSADLSDAARTTIQEATLVYVSAISAFEIGLKSRKGKLELPVPASDWFPAIIRHHDLTVLDITAEISLRATDLPPIHNDPCDRLIISTALLRQMPIITSDSFFTHYGVKCLA